ncbi:hypothetical protein [Xanthomonas dyei]|uniref:hypothetical protein n=1 Tax=Xanthomonas dyei TaxID=743699 RepID=UPI001EE7860A|nr:hypothetical protein [Xanthomonas dyei]
MERALNLEQRVRLGYAYLVYLKEREPEYFVTLTYRRQYRDRVAEDGMRAFILKLLNRMPRQTRKGFGGLVCAERHVNARFAGCYHFHFLFWGLDKSMPDAKDWLLSNVIKASAELYPRIAGPMCDCAKAEQWKRAKTCKGGLSCRGRQMSGAQFVDVQRIEYAQEVLHEYNVEDLYRLDKPAGGQLLDIGPKGVTGSLLRQGLI